MVNLSKNFGIPTTELDGIKQFADLKMHLEANDVFYLRSQNRGWLVLKKIKKGKWKGTYQNFLLKTKSQDKNVIRQVKV